MSLSSQLFILPLYNSSFNKYAILGQALQPTETGPLNQSD